MKDINISLEALKEKTIGEILKIYNDLNTSNSNLNKSPRVDSINSRGSGRLD